MSEAIYLRDPDGNGIELSWDRTKAEWPLTDDGRLVMDTHPLNTCPCRKSNTNVVMMQAAKDGPRFDAPEGVDWSPRRRILV